MCFNPQAFPFRFSFEKSPPTHHRLTDSGMTGGSGIGNNHCWISLEDGRFQDLDTWFTTMVILNPNLPGLWDPFQKIQMAFKWGLLGLLSKGGSSTFLLARPSTVALLKEYLQPICKESESKSSCKHLRVILQKWILLNIKTDPDSGY